MSMTSRYGLIVKWVLYALFGVAAGVMQRYVFSRLGIFGVTPLLLGSLAVVIGMFEGSIAGSICGGLLGASMYASGGGGELIYAAIYAIGGFAAGELCQRLFKKNLAGAMLASLGVNAAACLFYFLLMMWIPGRAGFYALVRVGLPEIVYSTGLTPLMYFPVRLLVKASGGLDE